MKQRLLAIFLILPLLISCAEMSQILRETVDETIGSLPSTNSSVSSNKYAGTYNGTVTVYFKGRLISKQKKNSMSLQVKNNGSVVLKVRGRTTKGTIKGNRINVPIKIYEKKQGITCKGSAALSGTINGSIASGKVKGGGNCSGLALKMDVNITGSFRANK